MKLQKPVIVAVWLNVTQTEGWVTLMINDALQMLNGSSQNIREDATVLHTSESPLNNHEDAFKYNLLQDLNM